MSTRPILGWAALGVCIHNLSGRLCQWDRTAFSKGWNYDGSGAAANKTSVLASAPFPYSKWNYQISASAFTPCLKMVNGGKLLLAGREYTPSGASVSLWAFDGKSFVKELESIEKTSRIVLLWTEQL